jgi:hypothetical protein
VLAEECFPAQIKAKDVEIHRLHAENRRLRELIRALLENDLDDDAADGVSVLQVWRREARQVLGC